MPQFVSVTEDENEESIEIPCEEDGTLSIISLSAQFPGACGLKYRSSSGGLRGVRLNADGKLHPPEDGQWGPITYLAVFPKDTKRKGDDAVDNPAAKMKRKGDELTSDLIVLGLPYSSTEEDMRKYFSQFGELVHVQVKKYPKTGVSKGFGFIRFSTVESQSICLSQRHMIGGRWCDVNLTNSNEGIGGQAAMSMKIFVARCTEDMSTEDLRDYFSKFGESQRVSRDRRCQDMRLKVKARLGNGEDTPLTITMEIHEEKACGRNQKVNGERCETCKTGAISNFRNLYPLIELHI